MLCNNLLAYSQNNSGKYAGSGLKVGLVLCGGGAKGVAHIGVLKKLEEEGITPDLIVGTSMGALIGGMYAMGYSATQLDSIVSNSDWNYLLSDNVKRSDVSFSKKMNDDIYFMNLPFYNLKSSGNKSEEISFIKNLPGGFVSGNNVLNLLNGLAIGYQDSINFRDLPIPFACIATDLSNGEEVVLDNGYLPLALRASMAIPGFFSPVEIDGKVLVDGGVVNNFPVDIARKMGADIIIGVDVQNDLYDAERLKSIDAVVSQLIGLLGNERYLINRKDVDIYIKPDVSNFGTMSFNREAVDTLQVNGYRAAIEREKEIVALSKKLKSSSNLRAQKIYNSKMAREIYKSTFRVGTIEVQGVDAWDKKWLLSKAGLKDSSEITGAQINRAISIFNGTKAFSSVTYKLSSATDDSELDKLRFVFVQGPTNILSVGARYDTEEAAAILLHLGVHQYDFHGSKADFTTRLSYNPYIKLSYSYLFRTFPRFNIEYEYNKKDINIYSNKNARNNIEYIYNGLDANLANINYFRYLDIKAGVKWQSFKFTNLLTDLESIKQNPMKAKSYLSLYSYGVMDTKDNKTFPTQGTLLEARLSWYLASFNKDFKRFIDAQFSVESAFDMGNDFVFLPKLYARSTFENNKEVPFYNFVGGSEKGRYIYHQLPFIGINFANIFDNSAVILRTDFRKKFGDNHYLYLMANYLRSSDKLTNMLSGRASDIWGFGLQYSYNTPLGPLTFNLHWSDYNKKKLGAYLSFGYFF